MAALLMRVVLPGAMVLYLVLTEQEFLRDFEASVPILLGGEILFVILHIVLTYVLLPVVWFFDLLDFFVDDNDVFDIIATFYRLCAQGLFWLLLIAITLRVVVEG